MAINEACVVWIEQRIDEELEAGTGQSEIGRMISSEILKHFETDVSSEAIRQRAIRRSVQNEQDDVEEKQEDTTPSHELDALKLAPRRHQVALYVYENPGEYTRKEVSAALDIGISTVDRTAKILNDAGFDLFKSTAPAPEPDPEPEPEPDDPPPDDDSEEQLSLMDAAHKVALSIARAGKALHDASEFIRAGNLEGIEGLHASDKAKIREELSEMLPSFNDVIDLLVEANGDLFGELVEYKTK